MAHRKNDNNGESNDVSRSAGSNPWDGIRNASSKFGDFAADDGEPITDEWLDQKRRLFGVGKFGRGRPKRPVPSDEPDGNSPDS